MSAWLAVLLVVAAVNPPRRRLELSSDARAVSAGALVTLLALIGLGLAGDTLLAALDITAPTFRVGVGLVLFVRAAVDLVTAPADPGPGDAGSDGPLVPVFFPVLFRPEVGLVAIAVAVDAGLGAMAVGAAGAFLLLLGLMRTARARYLRGLGMVVSTLLIVLAVDRIVDGVFAL